MLLLPNIICIILIYQKITSVIFGKCLPENNIIIFNTLYHIGTLDDIIRQFTSSKNQNK